MPDDLILPDDGAVNLSEAAGESDATRYAVEFRDAEAVFGQEEIRTNDAREFVPESRVTLEFEQ
jgi:hypothetical protein